MMEEYQPFTDPVAQTLAEAIQSAAVLLGIYNDDTLLSGPQLLMALCDIVRHVETLEKVLHQVDRS